MKFLNAIKSYLANKKGEAGGSSIKKLIGAVIVIFLVTALAPEMFSALLNATFTGSAPAWVGTVLTVLVGAGLVMIVWKAFD